MRFLLPMMPRVEIVVQRTSGAFYKHVETESEKKSSVAMQVEVSGGIFRPKFVN